LLRRVRRTGIGGFWIDGAEETGARMFDPHEERFTFAALVTILDRVADNLATIILDQQPDHFRWVELDRETGVITKASSFAGSAVVGCSQDHDARRRSYRTCIVPNEARRMSQWLVDASPP
jgi:hypothetical protein